MAGLRVIIANWFLIPYTLLNHTQRYNNGSSYIIDN